MSADLLFAWMMVFLRGLGIILLLPTLGGRPLPATVRVAISALLAGLLYGLVPRAATLPGGNASLIIAAIGEVVLGLVLGFIGRLVFSAVDMAGRMITQELGLMAAPGIDAPAPSSEPLAAFLSTFAGMMFFLLGGHIGALSAFVRSFDFAPAGAPVYSALAVEYLIAGTARVIELGFRISAPFMAMNFFDQPRVFRSGPRGAEDECFRSQLPCTHDGGIYSPRRFRRTNYALFGARVYRVAVSNSGNGYPRITPSSVAA